MDQECGMGLGWPDLREFFDFVLKGLQEWVPRFVFVMRCELGDVD